MTNFDAAKRQADSYRDAAKKGKDIATRRAAFSELVNMRELWQGLVDHPPQLPVASRTSTGGVPQHMEIEAHEEAKRILNYLNATIEETYRTLHAAGILR